MPAFSPSDYSAILLSLKVAVTATLLSLPFGFVVAYLMTYKRFRGRVVLDVIVNLPLTLPPVVIGYLLLLLLGQQGVIGRWVLQPLGIKLIFTWKAAVIGTAVVGFPLIVRAWRRLTSVSSRLPARWVPAGWIPSRPSSCPFPYGDLSPDPFSCLPVDWGNSGPPLLWRATSPA